MYLSLQMCRSQVGGYGGLVVSLEFDENGFYVYTPRTIDSFS